MSEYKSQCGCNIHVAQWTAKRKLVSVKQCPLHKAAPALLEACKAAYSHIEELREAWQRGAIHEADFLGGLRSNRNAEACTRLSRAIAAAEREKGPQ